MIQGLRNTLKIDAVICFKNQNALQADCFYNQELNINMRKLISFIIGVIIFSGLPLVGWGLNDFNGFVHNKARLSYIIMMAILSLLVVIFVPEEGRSRGKGKKLIKRQKRSLLFLQIIPVVIVIISPWSDRKGFAVFHEYSIIRFTGLVLTFMGFLLMNWSVIILDKQFSIDITIQDDHQLVTKGPYHYIRHPRYTGIIVFLLGISLVFLSWISLIFVFATIIVLIWRIQDEEKLMHEEFKTEWEEYKEKTYCLVPFVY